MSACATERSAGLPLIVPLPPLARSSVAAVLTHREALQLTPEQIRALEEIDDRRERLLGPLRSTSGDVADGGAPAPETASAPETSEPPRRRGGMRGGGRGGGGRRSSRGNQRSDDERGKLLLARWDEADTRAYLEAENVLGEAQRNPAREIASKFRADLS